MMPIVHFFPRTAFRQSLGSLIWVVSWVAMVVVALNLTPSEAGYGTHRQLGLPPCPSIYIFGRPCPGCGLTTSITALVQGDIVMSFSVHWLGPFVFLLWTLMAGIHAFALTRRQLVDTNTRVFNTVLLVFGGAFLAYGLTRFMLT